MKLLNINVGIKIDNSKEISTFINSHNPDFVTLQEITRHLDNNVHQQFKSKENIETELNNKYPYSFFGPLWVSKAITENGNTIINFGGYIEQGNQILSKYPIVSGTNEHYYKSFSLEYDWTDWREVDHGRAVLTSEIQINDKRLQILTVHGIWTKDKQGDQRTTDQCKYIVDVALRKNLPTIIAGDFNLGPNTESIQIVNKEFRNLNDEYNIKSTRPDFKDELEGGLNVVDYIFVNDMVKVNNFEVIDTDITDHLPLVLEFEM